MYPAERDRSVDYRVLGDSLGGDVRGQMNSAGDLRSTLQSRGLDVVYQPIINLHTGKIAGMEALARWTTPSGAAVSPDVFIPMAEESGLIGELGSQILTMAVRDAASWQSIAPVTVRINVSAQEVRSRTFYDDAMRTIDKVGLDAALLGLELPESTLQDQDEDTQDTLRQLHAAGVSLMLDDRGGGYTSLSCLESLPVADKLKIDRSLMTDDDPEGVAVVASVIALGRSFGLSVCAEGVENAIQHARVFGQGCDFTQGYYFARPTSRELVPQMLAAWATFLPV